MDTEDRDPTNILDMSSLEEQQVDKGRCEKYDEYTASSGEMEFDDKSLKNQDIIQGFLPVAHKLRFFSFMNLVERLMPETVPVGYDGPPSQEGIRFRHNPDLTFSAGDVRSAWLKEVPKDFENPLLSEKRPVIEVKTNFLGLTGAVSPLPTYIAEEVNHEDSENAVRRDFLDIFHHRIISLLYRVVMHYSPVKEHRVKSDDLWMFRILALSGLDPQIYLSKTSIPLGKLVRLAPLLVHRGRSVHSLEMSLNLVVEEFLGDSGKIKVEQFGGGWVPVHTGQRLYLGKKNTILGQNTMLGARAYDRSAKFKIVIGPLEARGKVDFSENGEGFNRIRDCTRLVLHDSLNYDVELHISAGASDRFMLSHQHPRNLGKNTRLGLKQREETILIRNVGEMK